MKSSLEFAIADVEEKQTRLDELEQAKTTAEQQLEEVQDKLQALQDERDADDSTVLESVKAEVRWLVAPHAVRMLTVFRWNPVARVEGAPSIRASVYQNPSISDNHSGIRDHLHQV